MKYLISLGDLSGKGEGRLVEVDFTEERAREIWRYTPPAELSIDGKGFTGASLSPDAQTLYVCSFNEVLRIDTQTWELTGELYQPCFNDLHHIAVDDHRLWVSNTGLDRVEVFSTQGAYLIGHELAPAWWSHQRLNGALPNRSSWERAISPGWDADPANFMAQRWEEASAHELGSYYKNSAEAPLHRRKLRDFVHPNHVSLHHHGAWVTCFQQRHLRELATGQIISPTLPGHPHDGCWDLRNELFWVSCTNGILVALELDHSGQLYVSKQLDTYNITGRSGWCRGLHVSPNGFALGLTRISVEPGYRWANRDISNTETSALWLDPITGQLLAQVSLEGFGQHPKAYSILPMPEVTKR